MDTPQKNLASAAFKIKTYLFSIINDKENNIIVNDNNIPPKKIKYFLLYLFKFFPKYYDVRNSPIGKTEKTNPSY